MIKMLPSLLCCVLAVGCGISSGNDDSVKTDGPEKLFRQMEEKVARAKTLNIDFETVMEGGGLLARDKKEKVVTRGTFHLAGRSFHFASTQGKGHGELISDGSKMKEHDTAHGLALAGDTPRDAEKLLKEAIVQFGVLPAIDVFAHGPDNLTVRQGRRELKVVYSDFRFGKREKVGGKDAQVIEYKVAAFGSSAPMTLWLDVRTGLPLKRSFPFMGGPLTETYSTFVLDGKIDDKLFELPK